MRGEGDGGGGAGAQLTSNAAQTPESITITNCASSADILVVPCRVPRAARVWCRVLSGAMKDMESIERIRCFWASDGCGWSARCLTIRSGSVSRSVFVAIKACDLLMVDLAQIGHCRLVVHFRENLILAITVFFVRISE